jgi:hypothetical protein
VVFHAESAAPGRYPFEVTYTDDVGQAAAATYTAVVLAPPAAGEVRLALASEEDAALVDPVGAARVPGAGELSLGSVGAPEHGEVSAEGGPGGLLRYQPEAGWSGRVAWTAEVCDQVGQCASVAYVIDIAPGPGSLSESEYGDGELGDGGGGDGSGEDGGGSGGNGDGGIGNGGEAGSLPVTGPSLEPGTYVGLGLASAGLVLAGCVLLVAWRRRRDPGRVALGRPGGEGL